MPAPVGEVSSQALTQSRGKLPRSRALSMGSMLGLLRFSGLQYPGLHRTVFDSRCHPLLNLYLGCKEPNAHESRVSSACLSPVPADEALPFEVARIFPSSQPCQEFLAASRNVINSLALLASMR